jgi:ABC-type branched-subunit amino acid transport system substrate-binding protein
MDPTVRVGVLNDMTEAPATGAGVGDITEWLEREVAQVRASGRLTAEVQFVHAYGLGLPEGTAAAVERAYRELVDAGALLMVGPAIGDNALIATPLAERLRVPTINWAGAERARGEWMFQLQVGSHEDESLVMARHMAAIGVTRLGVVFDQSPIGTRHLEYLRDEARILGLDIAGTEVISPLAEDAHEAVAKVLAQEPEGFAYLGLGLSAPAVARALTAGGWQGARIMNTAGIRGYYGDFAQICDGWFYVDMHSDANRTLAALRETMALPPERALWAAKGHDLGRLVAEGLARAP